MSNKRLPWLIPALHLLVLVLIYVPFIGTPVNSLEIILPALLNLLLVCASFIASLVASIVPNWRKYCGYWWLGFGAVLLASFPVCLETMQINAAMNH